MIMVGVLTPARILQGLIHAVVLADSFLVVTNTTAVVNSESSYLEAAVTVHTTIGQVNFISRIKLIPRLHTTLPHSTLQVLVLSAGSH